PDGANCRDIVFDWTSGDSFGTRPGQRIRFTMTVPPDSPALPQVSWQTGTKYNLVPCKDLDPGGAIVCENNTPANMRIDDIIPGATWQELSLGDRNLRTPAVWGFDWQVPDDVTPRTYEIVFMVSFPEAVNYAVPAGPISC